MIDKKKTNIIIMIYLLTILYALLHIEGNPIIGLFKYFIIIIIGILALRINLYFISKKELKIHLKFIISAIFFGILLIFAIPILHGIDEGAHFFKVYSFVEGTETVYDNKNQLKDTVPLTIFQADSIETYEDTILLINKKIDKSCYILKDDYFGAKLYSIISYIPYVISMFIFQKILTLDIIGVIYTGRIFAFIFWLLISAYTIKIIPKRKEFIAFLCLMPINLTLVTTYTGDLITNSAILLFLAYWYRLYFEKRVITKKEIAIMTILGVMSACAKLVYAMIFFILFLLPSECFKNKKHKIISLIIMMGIIVIATFLNLAYVGDDLISAYPKINLQKEFILSNFFEYIWILITTIIKNFWMYLFQFTTGRTTMCHNMITVNDIISLIYVVILVLSILFEEAKIELSKKAKILIGVIISAIIIIIFTSLYLQWTATQFGVGVDMIYGVQGRYFLPIVALFILITTKTTKTYDKNYLWTGVLLINLITLCQIIVKF